MVYWTILGACKKKNILLTWSDVDLTSSVCVCPLVGHGKQPMKMHTEVTLLYKIIYIMVYIDVYLCIMMYKDVQ